MKKCCDSMLQEVKSYIKEQADIYRSTRRQVVARALDLLYDDLVFKYECEIIESKANENISDSKV